ncbi:hypothetical protein D3C87_42090 [compost metagenome]
MLSCSEAKKNSEKLQKNKINEIKKMSEDDCVTNFDDFFKRFAEDSTYQKKYIKFPLNIYFHEDLISDNFSVKVIKNQTNFKYIDFTKDHLAMKNEYDKFTIEKTIKNNRLIYKRLGYDNGIHIEYEFKLIDGCWYLIKIMDQSS